MARTTASQLKREFAELDALFDQISLDNQQTRKFLSKTLQPVARDARRLVPKPGYPGDKPEFKPLRNTIRVVVRDYGSTWYGAVGPQWPAGAHGHLVEGFTEPARHHSHGLPTGRTLTPTPFIGPAYERNRRAIIQALAAFTGRQLKKATD